MKIHVCGTAALLTFAIVGPPGRAPDVRAAMRTATVPSAAAVFPAPTRLQVRGTHFTRADGTAFDWRGITGFRLLEMISRGRIGEAEAFLDWCAARGLSVVRVLTMAKHLFELGPDQGRAALPRLLEIAAQRGLYVEVVALADTAEIAVDADRHVREIGAIAAGHANAIVEIANEPVHPTQAARVQDPAELERLARLVPDAVPVALGAADDDRFAAADYATVHFPRDSADGGWGHVTALATAAQLLRKWNKPLVNDEPIGAGEQLDPGRRDNEPERFRAAALLSRMIGIGSTFHYQGGLHARVPERRERECFDAWQEAWTLLPDGVAFTLSEPGSDGSPVRSVDGDFAGAYTAARGDRAWLLVTRTRGEVDVRWADGWRPSDPSRWEASTLRPAVRVR